jgi:hypothetical protein
MRDYDAKDATTIKKHRKQETTPILGTQLKTLNIHATQQWYGDCSAATISRKLIQCLSQFVFKNTHT